jgi:formylglycine-generating enzyme required for sulfatase activity
VKTEQGFMVPYRAKIPGTEITFEMQPIPGGKFKLGSPAAEADRKQDEGPQVEIEVDPFWMGTYEVTWAEYKQYMKMHDLFKKLSQAKLHPITDQNKPYVVTAPSNLYDPTFTFQFGEDPRQPAITMSQFAAKQYTKWLSGISGAFYRLPTEAEWEYACRAGTTTAYSFGDDADGLDDFAWFMDNAEESTHKVGEKKPSPWGLFDMHGNVAEWVLDEYTEKGYEKLAGKNHKAADAVQWPTKLFPRTIRGGSWDDDAAGCRSASRRGTDDDAYREDDPNFPKSPWWFTSGHGLAVGMRIIRPLHPPADKDRAKFWEADIDQIREDSNQRIDQEGRGARGVANPELPAAIKKLSQ